MPRKWPGRTQPQWAMAVVLEVRLREEIMEGNLTGPSTLYKVRMIPSLNIDTSWNIGNRGPLAFYHAD